MLVKIKYCKTALKSLNLYPLLQAADFGSRLTSLPPHALSSWAEHSNFNISHFERGAYWFGPTIGSNISTPSITIYRPPRGVINFAGSTVHPRYSAVNPPFDGDVYSKKCTKRGFARTFFTLFYLPVFIALLCSTSGNTFFAAILSVGRGKSFS